MNRQKPVVLFLIYHGKSHFISCFHIARSIQNTHHVVFAGVEFFKEFVKKEGFNFYSLKTVPFGIGLDEWYNSVTGRKPIYWKTVSDRWTDRLYHLRKSELTQLLMTVDPTHIVLDAQQSTDFVVLYKMITKRGISIAIVHNMLPSTYNHEFPPLNSSVTCNKADIARATAYEISKKRKLRWKQRFRYLGPSDEDIIHRGIRRNQIPEDFISQDRSLFNLTLKGIPEFVLMFKEFDLPARNYGPLLSFIGSQVDGTRQSSDSQFRSLQKHIDENIANGRRMIYCSLGTIPPANRADVIQFLKAIIKATQEFLLIISFKLENAEQAELKTDNHSIYFFDYVPQLEILPKASVFITHGGLNSIKESIDNEIPMLVCPVDANYDVMGNSARVAYHELGVLTKLTEDAGTIKQKLDQIISRQVYKDNLKKFKRFNDTHSLKPFFDFVSSTPHGDNADVD